MYLDGIQYFLTSGGFFVLMHLVMFRAGFRIYRITPEQNKFNFFNFLRDKGSRLNTWIEEGNLEGEPRMEEGDVTFPVCGFCGETIYGEYDICSECGKICCKKHLNFLENADISVCHTCVEQNFINPENFRTEEQPEHIIPMVQNFN